MVLQGSLYEVTNTASASLVILYIYEAFQMYQSQFRINSMILGGELQWNSLCSANINMDRSMRTCSSTLHESHNRIRLRREIVRQKYTYIKLLHFEVMWRLVSTKERLDSSWSDSRCPFIPGCSLTNLLFLISRSGQRTCINLFAFHV